MAQYPISDDQGLIDGLNYVLSGPSSLGQNFNGFSSSLNGDATGNFRPPFAQDNFGTLPNVSLYVAPISLSTSEMLDSRTLKFTFATPLVQAPFIPGQAYGIDVVGVSVTDYHDYVYNYGYQIGITECTTTYVLIKLNKDLTVLAPGTGGTIGINSMDLALSTDCNAKVTVTGAQDKIILSAQLNNTIYTDPTYYPGSYNYTVELNRYVGGPTYDPINPDYRFEFDKTIALKEYLVSTPAAGVTNEYETLFINIIDQPVPGYYWYILEVTYSDNAGGQIVTNSVLGLRSFAAQVLKP
jgi:hypothetical protein